MEAKYLKKNNNKLKKEARLEITEKALTRLKLVLFIALLIVLFYPPFGRGLYFELEQLPAIIFVLVIFTAFWIYKYLKRDNIFLKTPLEYAALAFPIVYFLSVFAAVVLRQAILEWLKYCMYFAVFYMLAELADSLKWRLVALWVIVASATGVSILGIDAAAGGGIAKVINRILKGLGAGDDIIFDTVTGWRVQSTLQYPNALAAYLMAVYFVCLGLAASSGRLWSKAISGGICSVLLVTFLLTGSRGGYVLLPAAAVLYLILLPKGSRIRGAVHGITTFIPALIVFFRISPYAGKAEGHTSIIWLNVLLGIVASAILIVIGNYTARWLEKVNWKVYAVLAFIFVIAGIACAVYVLNASVPLILDNSTAESNKSNYVTQSERLIPGKEYKLSFDINATDTGDNPYACKVTINSRNIKDILFRTNTLLATYTQKETKGTEVNEIIFKVPEDSEIVDFNFMNYYAGTKAVIDNARIIDADTGKVYKELMLSNRYLPVSIIRRFRNFSIDTNIYQRLIYYKDGLKIFKDRWFLGAGGGAWAFIYFQYQSYLYWSTQAHNYPLQLAVECGILGIIALLLLLASIIYMLVQLYRKKSEGNQGPDAFQAALLSAVAALLAHSVFDFNFSLSAIFLLFWELAAIFNSTYVSLVKESSDIPEYISNKNISIKDVSKKVASGKKAGKAFSGKLNANPIVMAVLSLVVLLVPVFMKIANSYRNWAIVSLHRQDVESAFANFKTAVSLDPLEPSYLIDYANLLIQKPGRTKKDVQEANNCIEKAESLSYWNPKLLPKVAAFYLHIGKIDKGLQLFDRSVELCPFVPNQWQQKVNAYMQVALYYFKNNDAEAGLEYADKTLGIINEAEEANKRNLNPFTFNSQTMGMLEKFKYLKDKYEEGGTVDIDKTVFYSINDLDINFDGIPDQWKANSPEEIKLSYGNGSIIVENISETEDKLGYIQTRELNFLPEKEYIVSVELENGDAGNALSYLVPGITGKAIELTSVGNNLYTAEFSTPVNYNSEKSSTLRLYIKGSISIKSVSILEK